METQQLLEIMTRRLVEALHPTKIYLFGSRARGTERQGSDYDFLVVVQDPLPEDEDLEEKGYMALLGLGVSKDVLVWSEPQFQRQAHLKASLPGTVLHEGKLLYAA